MKQQYSNAKSFKIIKKRFYFLTIMIMVISAAIITTEIKSLSLKLEENFVITEQKFVWRTPKVVSSESDFRSLRPCIAIDNFDNIHFVYQDMTDLFGAGNDEDIFHKIWNSTTESWSEVTVLSVGSSDTSKHPSIVSDRFGNLHVTWIESEPLLSSGSDTDIFYCSWNATTNSWSDLELISSASTGNIFWVDITARNDTIYSVWQDASNYAGNGADEDILFSKRFVNGTWTTPETVSIEGSATSYYPDIEVDNKENVYVSWADASNYDGSGFDWDIFYRFRNATTEQWSTTEVISNTSNDKSDRAEMVLLENNSKLISWVDYSNILGTGLDHDIFYRFWNGTTELWGDIQVLTTESTGDSDVPSIISDVNGTIHFVWFDTTNFDNAGADQDIFYKKWDPKTNTWSDQTVISADSTADSWRPKIAIDSSETIHIVWQDRTLNYAGSGNDIDILYSSGAEYQPSAHLTIIDKPQDEIFTTASSNLNLTWLLSDINTTDPVYTININDGIELVGNWTSDIPIIYTLSSLNIGNYVFQFEAMDGWGETVTDMVVVTIESGRVIWLDPLANGLIGLSIAVGTVGLTAVLFIVIKRRRS